MKFTILSSILFAAGIAQAALNGACSVGSTPGVCIATSSCTSGGGTYYTGYCPNDPANIKCCVKKSCGSGGNCRFTSACTTGNIASNLCPGPSNFKCCLPATKCTPPAINAATINLIKGFESFQPNPYRDPVGLLTVGYGHLCAQPKCAEVPYSFPLTTTTASALLQTDMKTYTKCVSDYIKDSIRLNANQYGALSSWAMNVGCGPVQTSTLIARLNAGNNPNTVASEELPKWNRGGGKVLPGLVRRRAAEVALFKTPSSVIAHPPC